MKIAGFGSLTGLTFALTGLALLQPVNAQTPEYNGFFEPVNYSEDLAFNDVYFVTVDVGYVAGQGATILKTNDGGANWNVQLGGDPGSQEREILDLRFVDETHGWATHRASTVTNLLRTTDGETWEPVGTIEEHYRDYFFTTETEGVFTTNDKIYRTTDAGATWNLVYNCQVRAEVDGLARAMKCEVERMHFPNPAVGFAIAYVSGDLSAVLKTADGGNTWSLAGLMAGDRAREGGIFFTDELNGIVRTNKGISWITADGGQTWKMLIATNLGRNIRFADPGVAWSFADLCTGMGCENARLSYTIDGGRRWTSRSLPFPAGVKAFSLPRRDRGYAVGDHGMIYRYRLVPSTETVAGSVAAPAMPMFDSPLDDQVEQFEEQVAALEEALGGAQGEGAATGDLPADFAEQLTATEATLTAAVTEAPQFVGKYKNLNLVLIGVQMSTDLPAELQGLRDSFQTLKQGESLQEVAGALPELRSKSQGLAQMVRGYFQET